jgi:hypothetical protein
MLSTFSFRNLGDSFLINIVRHVKDGTGIDSKGIYILCMTYRLSIDKKERGDGVIFCACVFINLKYTNSLGYLQEKTMVVIIMITYYCYISKYCTLHNNVDYY